MNKFTRHWLTLPLLVLPISAAAKIDTTPVVGGVFNASEVLKNQIVSGLTYSTRFARDMTLFTIGGMTLDAFILTLPLDSATKKRVITQLSNPDYAIPLGYFLYQYYERYTGVSDEDEFKRYVLSVYDKQAVIPFQHSLFQLQEGEQTPPHQADHKDQGHQPGIELNQEFYAAMVTIYDALVEIGDWQQQNTLPDRYQYLSHSPQDQALIKKIQPIVVGVLKQLSQGMEAGEMKHALQGIIADNDESQMDKVNNRAEAITITLIDFVRLNVLKAYRQFVYQDERQQKVANWLDEHFQTQPQAVIDFLRARQHRRLAVQITVDGLQQGLVEGLVTPNSRFIGQIYQRYQQRQQLTPSTNYQTPEHQPSMRFAQILAQQPYRDPYYLPFFKRLYAEHRPSIADVGISSTPTISVRNLPIIKTGAKVSGQGGTGIPNFHFVDRKQDRAYYFYGNDALQLDRLMNEHGAKTMFDRLNYLNTMNCNAQYDWNAHVSFDSLVNLGAGESLRDFGEKRCVKELNRRARVETRLTEMRAALIRQIEGYQQLPFWAIVTRYTQQWKIEDNLERYAALEHQGMPDYLLVYNPWPDHFAHFVGPFSDEIIMPSGELNRLDFWIRQLESAYHSAGVYGQTLWGMAGDHGLAPVYYTLNPEKVVFEPLQDTLDYPLVVKKISSDEGEGPKLTNALNYPSNKEVDVVVASTAGGNFMLDFFNAKAGWQAQPNYQELVNWQPRHSQGKGVDIIDYTVNQLKDTLDYLVVRDGECGAKQCRIRLVATRNGQRVDEWIERQGDRYFYQTYSTEASLLGIETLNPYRQVPTLSQRSEWRALRQHCLHPDEVKDSNTWCNAAEWREVSRLSLRPDAIAQLAALYEEPRAGTVNLFPRQGIGYNTKVPGRHAGESYLEKDAFLGFWGAQVGRGADPLLIEENGSLAPTLYEYLTGNPVQVGQDGWGYPSLINRLDIKTH
ncbi:alkaline phosphatase family protein [Vibrio olivae]|uniref:Alkaline phosphatase family protein n=1 Tax=Vibrio olivae TaxID=1243002 RepID=A0ABV5HM47_9VIBR